MSADRRRWRALLLLLFGLAGWMAPLHAFGGPTVSRDGSALLVAETELRAVRERPGRLTLVLDLAQAPDAGRLAARLGRFVTAGDWDPAGRELRFALKNGGRTTVGEDGEGMRQIRFLADGRHGIRLRTGLHPGYRRLVFEGPEAAAAEVHERGGEIRLRFGTPLAAATVARLERMDRLRAVRRLSDKGLALQAARGVSFRILRLPPERLVVDLRGDPARGGAVARAPSAPPNAAEGKQTTGPQRQPPGGTGAVSAAAAQPGPASVFAAIRPAAGSPAGTVSPGADAEKENGAAPAFADVDRGAPPPGSVRVDAIEVTGVREARSAVLRFHWPKPVGAAAFERAGVLWILFDGRARTVIAEADQLAFTLRGAARSFRQIPHEKGTLFRLDLQGRHSPALFREGAAWALLLDAPVEARVPEPRLAFAEDPPRMRVPGAHGHLAFHDPIVGDELDVLTFDRPAALGEARSYVDFSLLASRQGVVVKAKAADLVVRPEAPGFMIRRPGGLHVALAEQPRNGSTAEVTRTDRGGGHVAPGQGEEAKTPGSRPSGGSEGDASGAPGTRKERDAAKSPAGKPAAVAVTSAASEETVGAAPDGHPSGDGEHATGQSPGLASSPDDSSGPPGGASVAESRAEFSPAHATASAHATSPADATTPAGATTPGDATADVASTAKPREAGTLASAVPDGEGEPAHPTSTEPPGARTGDAGEHGGETEHRSASPPQHAVSQREMPHEGAPSPRAVPEGGDPALPPWQSTFGLRELAGLDPDALGALRRRTRERIAEGPPEDRPPLRIELARLYLADAMAIEALSILHMTAGARAVDADPVLRTHRTALAAASAYLAGQPERASRYLESSDLAGDEEASLWRAAIAASRKDWEEAARGFGKGASRLRAYPERLRFALGLVAAMTAMQTGDADGAFAWIDRLDRMPLSKRRKHALHFVEALLLARDGATGEALGLLDGLAEKADWVTATKAAYTAINLRREVGRLDVRQARAAMERQRPFWLGHPWEAVMLAELGRLRDATGDPGGALALWRMVLDRHPDTPAGSEIMDSMRRTFAAALAPDRRPPLPLAEAFLLYRRYPELLPAGGSGDAITLHLARRLLEAGLAEPAEALAGARLPQVAAGARRPFVRVLIEAALARRAPGVALSLLDRAGLAKTPPDSPFRLLRARAELARGNARAALALLEDVPARQSWPIALEAYWFLRDWPVLAGLEPEVTRDLSNRQLPVAERMSRALRVVEALGRTGRRADAGRLADRARRLDPETSLAAALDLAASSPLASGEANEVLDAAERFLKTGGPALGRILDHAGSGSGEGGAAAGPPSTAVGSG